MAMLIQTLSAKLGIATGRNLAEILTCPTAEEPLLAIDEVFEQKKGRHAAAAFLLRPGIGEHFTIVAHCLRVGSRVGTARMDFCGPDGTLMSAGAAAYIVS